MLILYCQIQRFILAVLVKLIHSQLDNSLI